MPLADQNELWTSMRTAYHPSALYRVGVVLLADEDREAPRIEETEFKPPEGRQRGIMVDDVAGLVAALKNKGLV